MTRLIETIRYEWARWRLRRVLRPIEKQIDTARRRHQPVSHLIEARRSLILFGLRGAR